MPSLAAAVMASLAGWMIDAIIEPYLGLGARIFVGIILSIYVYVYARNWLLSLRGR
jgi:hypothetical protein